MYLQIDGTNARIAGTMHSFPAASPELPEWISEAYEWAEDLVIEADPPSILPFRQLGDGSKLADHLPAALLEELQSIWPDALGTLDDLKPWAVFLAVPQTFTPLVAGVEAHVTEWAKQESKPIYTLETGPEIAAVFDALPTALFVELLQPLISDPDATRSAIKAMHAAWLTRSLSALLNVAVSLPMYAVPALRKAILLTRNRTWLPKFRGGAHAQRRTLFLVGALHLCGEGSVPELLLREGHSLSLLE